MAHFEKLSFCSGGNLQTKLLKVLQKEQSVLTISEVFAKQNLEN